MAKPPPKKHPKFNLKIGTKGLIMKTTRQNPLIAILVIHSFITFSQVIIEATRLYFDYF